MRNRCCFYQHKLLSCLAMSHLLVWQNIFCSWLIPEAAGLECSVLSHCGNWLLKSHVFKDFQCRTDVFPAFIRQEWWSVFLWPGEKFCLAGGAHYWAAACNCEGERCLQKGACPPCLYLMLPYQQHYSAKHQTPILTAYVAAQFSRAFCGVNFEQDKMRNSRWTPW